MPSRFFASLILYAAALCAPYSTSTLRSVSSASFPFLPFRGMPSRPFLRQLRRDLIPTSALPTSAHGVLCSASPLPSNHPWCPVPASFASEDYVHFAERKLRFFSLSSIPRDAIPLFSSSIMSDVIRRFLQKIHFSYISTSPKFAYIKKNAYLCPRNRNTLISVPSLPHLVVQNTATTRIRHGIG